MKSELLSLFLLLRICSTDVCQIGREQLNLECAINLDCPTWPDQNPYCNFDSSAVRSQDTFLFWTVLEQYPTNECGMCINVTGPGGSVVVRMVDMHTSYDMELNIETYESIGGIVDDGSMLVDYVPVPCPVTGPLRYQISSDTSDWWVSIVIWDHAIPLSKVEFSWSGSSGWLESTRSEWNEWELAPSTQIEAPLNLRITAYNDETLEDSIQTILKGAVLTGNVQFSNPCTNGTYAWIDGPHPGGVVAAVLVPLFLLLLLSPLAAAAIIVGVRRYLGKQAIPARVRTRVPTAVLERLKRLGTWV